MANSGGETATLTLANNSISALSPNGTLVFSNDGTLTHRWTEMTLMSGSGERVNIAIDSGLKVNDPNSVAISAGATSIRTTRLALGGEIKTGSTTAITYDLHPGNMAAAAVAVGSGDELILGAAAIARRVFTEPSPQPLAGY